MSEKEDEMTTAPGAPNNPLVRRRSPDRAVPLDREVSTSGRHRETFGRGVYGVGRPSHNRVVSSGLALALMMTASAALAAESETLTSLAADAELAEARTTVPTLKPAAPFEPQDNVLLIEISEYAGYAGLVVANGGLAPSEDSLFFKKFGFKVKITKSEEDSWSPLNSGQIGASVTTADVLPLYGQQLQVVVPVLISFSRGADSIVVRSDLRQINDLKGKTLATAQFNEADFLLRYLGQQAGLDIHLRADFDSPAALDKINLIACADSFGAGDIFLRDLTAGRQRLDGCVTWDPKTTEVVEKAGGKAKILVSNRNLLVIADLLIVNKAFAAKHSEMVRGLVEGLLEGNAMVRANPDAHLKTLGAAFGWSAEDARGELQKVHFANLPENLAFFAGTIDAAGSYSYIYESAVLAYGSKFIPRPVSSEKFVEQKHLQALQEAGKFANQRAEIKPIRSGSERAVEEPLLARDIRFLFQPNSAELDLKNAKNLEDLKYMSRMLQVSPGSTLLLRGHVDNSMIKEFEKQGGPAFVQKMALKAVQLSKERCESVRKAVVQLHNADTARLESIGCGWNEPLGTDMDQNRRVEVQWFTVE